MNTNINEDKKDKLSCLDPILKVDSEVDWLNNWFMLRFKTQVHNGKAKIISEVGMFWTIIICIKIIFIIWKAF